MSTKKVVFISLILLVVFTVSGIVIGMKILGNNENKNIKTFSLNLEDIYCDIKDSDSIIKLNITIETFSKDSLEILTNKVYLIRNNINEIVRNKTEEELKGKSGQVNLQKEIKDNLLAVFKDESIVNIYFNEFVIQ